MKREFYDGDKFEHNGRTYTVNFPVDWCAEPPWDQGGGNGIVSEWTAQIKRPGERVLCEDHGRKRYYDWQGTITRASAEGWGLSPLDLAKLASKLGRAPTKGEIVAASVEADFKHMRRWCDNEWAYVGVVVTDDAGRSESVWGLESDCDALLAETAREIADAMHPLASAMESCGLELASD